MEAYKRGSHTVWDCKYHVVWVTKYRYSVLGGDVGQRCRELMRERRAHEISIHAGSINLSAHTAVRSVDRLLNGGHMRIIEADLADYFGSIPHAELLKSVARRVSDRHMLHLIKMWLETPVEEDDDKGGKRRTTTARDTGRGVPQGAPVSPLLLNLYMRRFVLGWKKRGLETRFGAKIVVYADDYVICCKGAAEQAMVEMRRLMLQLKLTINDAKTHTRRLPQERFVFLGYDFGRHYSAKTGRAYLCAQPPLDRTCVHNWLCGHFSRSQR